MNHAVHDGCFVLGRVSPGEYVSTHLARPTDGGATWGFVKALNVAVDGPHSSTDALR